MVSLNRFLGTVLPVAVLGLSVSFAFAEEECTEAIFGKMTRANNKNIVCDPELNAWRDATMMESSIQKSCTKKNLNEKMAIKNISLVCSDDDWEGTFVDSRDNRKYAVAIIANQVWMKENLDYEKMFGIDCKQCEGTIFTTLVMRRRCAPRAGSSRALTIGTLSRRTADL